MEHGSRPMIEAKGLSKFYGPFVAIEDISFAIPEGQIVAFLGPNGAGKSTTMKILTGFLAPSEGTAAIAGLDIQRQRIEASRKFGYLPENGPLYLDMTPGETLRFFGEARGLEGTELDDRIRWAAQQCAVSEVLEKPIGKLSKGFRQRVGLAQALLHDPEVLIMDEPTAGLDPNQIREFRHNLQQLGQTKTILISTHILREVEVTADRVLVVHEGRLIFDGLPAEIEKDGSLEGPFYEMTDYGRPVGAFGERRHLTGEQHEAAENQVAGVEDDASNTEGGKE
jgi:ABC-2 type transport system ATP-binding protein